MLYSIDPHTFGRQMAHYRQQANYSLWDLARLTELSGYQLSCYERGSVAPDIDQAALIAEALDVSVRDLAFAPAAFGERLFPEDDPQDFPADDTEEAA